MVNESNAGQELVGMSSMNWLSYTDKKGADHITQTNSECIFSVSWAGNWTQSTLLLWDIRLGTFRLK